MFGPEASAAARAHAIAEFPREACGIVVAGRYEPCANMAIQPTAHYEIAGDVMQAAWARGLQAVIHSHPTSSEAVSFGAIPSAHDMRQQIAHAVPFGIVATDGKVAAPPVWFGDQCPVAAFSARTFRHAVTDCYGAIRDFYRQDPELTQRQLVNFRAKDWPWTVPIALKEFPRDWEWWLAGKDEDGDPTEPLNLYKDGFAAAGFVEIDGSQRRCGDVILIEVFTRELERAGMKRGTPFHGAVYIGRDMMFHHLTSKMPVDRSRLAVEEPVGRWRNHITHWLRYQG